MVYKKEKYKSKKIIEDEDLENLSKKSEKMYKEMKKEKKQMNKLFD